jgi:uncharacterized protein
VSEGPGSWRFRVAAAIDDVGRQAWQQMETSSFYLSHDWLRAVEGMLCPEHPYLVVERRGEVLAVAACQLVRSADVYAFYSPQVLLLDPDRLAELQRWLSPDRARRLAELAGDVRPDGGRLLPALLATAPRGYRSGIGYHRSLTAGERDRAARLVLDAFDELAAGYGAGTGAFLYLPEGSEPHLERALLARAYLPTVLGGECSLDVPWPDFEGYLAHFRSGRRHTLRGDIQRFSRAGCTVEMGGVELLGDELAPLQAATQTRYGHHTDPARTARWYARVRAELPRYARVSVARRGADVLGFGLFYEARGELYARAAGFDYGRLDGERSYFSVVFYEPIRYAIAAGLGRIHYGIEGYEAKLERGCELRPVRGWFRFRAGDTRRLAELLGLHAEAQLARRTALRRTFGLS